MLFLSVTILGSRRQGGGTKEISKEREDMTSARPNFQRRSRLLPSLGAFLRVFNSAGFLAGRAEKKKERERERGRRRNSRENLSGVFVRAA